MQTKIQIFRNEVFGEIRTLTNEKGETFFVGKDVAKHSGTATLVRHYSTTLTKKTRAIG